MFFRLALLELGDSALFEGGDGGKFFSHDLEKLEQKAYFYAGQLAAMSILHEGPGLHFLQEDLARLVLGLPVDLTEFDINLLPDRDLKDILQQVFNGINLRTLYIKHKTNTHYLSLIAFFARVSHVMYYYTITKL